MSQKTITMSQIEKNKIQMLRQLKQLKKDIKENAKVCADISKMLRKIKEDKARAAEAWEKRRQEKLAAGKKVNIIFVCSRPAAWNVFKSTCEEFIKDKRYNVTIVSVPELGTSGAWAFIGSDYGVNCSVLEGYNPHSKTWIDLESLEPDYVFFQTPYNAHRPIQYNSNAVSQYAKICYSLYGMLTFQDNMANITSPPDFLQDTFVVFTQTEYYSSFLNNKFKTIPLCDARTVLSGDAKLEAVKNMPKDTESPVWRYPRSDKKLRVVWTPRWTQSGNLSHFFDYKDKVLELCKQNENIELVSRPHPLTFSESIINGCLSAQEVEDYKQQYTLLPNASLDARAAYQDTFVSSDVLLTDMSSIFNEYAVTGKPIIYCHKTNDFNEHSREVAKGFYWANNWEEVKDILAMIGAGHDPLKDTRNDITKKMYYFPENGVASLIHDYITKHFFYS